MQTFQEQQDFFNGEWPKIKSVLENDGAAAAAGYIRDHYQDMKARVMHFFVRTGVVFQDWQGKNLDAVITLADAGIESLIREAETAADDETRQRRINMANVISYNLGADLAFCWGDDFERNDSHFLRGEKAGEDCLKWREELGNPPSTFSMAHWVVGVHQLARGKAEQAMVSFKQSLHFAEVASEEDGRPTTLAEGDGSIQIAHGWIALTGRVLGLEQSSEDYRRVMEIFTEQTQSSNEHSRGDAEIYLMQLQNAEKLLLT